MAFVKLRQVQGGKPAEEARSEVYVDVDDIVRVEQASKADSLELNVDAFVYLFSGPTILVSHPGGLEGVMKDIEAADTAEADRIEYAKTRARLKAEEDLDNDVLDDDVSDDDRLFTRTEVKPIRPPQDPKAE